MFAENHDLLSRIDILQYFIKLALQLCWIQIQTDGANTKLHTTCRYECCIIAYLTHLISVTKHISRVLLINLFKQTLHSDLVYFKFHKMIRLSILRCFRLKIRKVGRDLITTYTCADICKTIYHVNTLSGDTILKLVKEVNLYTKIKKKTYILNIWFFF